MIPQNQNRRAPSADEIIALLDGICQPLAAARTPLHEAAGRVLREPVCAPEDQPPFDRSAMDGFAIRLDDANLEFKIVDEIRAGDWKPRELQIGEVVQISTGGALPGDGLQVVMKENVRVAGKILTVVERDSNRCIRFRGEDACAGQVLVESGTTLTPGALALLASVGHAQPMVTRLPRVLHLATGNEIVPPEQTPLTGQIRDSNSVLVRAFLKHWQVKLEQRRMPEDESAVRAALAEAWSSAFRRSDEPPMPPEGGTPNPDPDLLLVSGGASVGEHDFTRRLLEHFGFEILVCKTALRPGRPLIVARRGNQIAFGLPGNPLAHFVCLNLFVRVTLEKFSGRAAENIFQHGTLAAKLESGRNARETFWPARSEMKNGGMKLTPLRWSSSGDLTALVLANSLIRVKAESSDLAAGAAVEFVPTI